MRRFGKKCNFMLAMMLGLSMVGCQKSPEEPIVKNKDLDNMIESAEDTSSGVSDVADIAVDYETYQAEINDESLNVSVNVDAQVMIPEVDSLSVYRVRQMDITQEFLDKVCDELAGDAKLYDSVSSNLVTKKELEAQLAYETQAVNEELEALKEDEAQSADYDTYYQESMKYLEDLKEEYENAPDEPIFAESDGLLHSVAELYQSNQGNETYEWLYSLNKDGDVFEAISDGKDGYYISIYAQNNINYGNCIKFRKSRYDYVTTGTVLPGGTSNGVWRADESMPTSEEKGNSYSFLVMQPSDVKHILEAEDATISEEEAQKAADDLLARLEFDSYKLIDGGLYSEIPDMRNYDYLGGYHNVYIFNYIRDIDGVDVENTSSKHTEGWSGENYVKMDWPGETVRIIVNDDGIIGFELSAPLDITETVVEKASLKTFDEIKDTFEDMVVISNAMDDALDTKVEINIDSVTLNYTRISEADSFDTGLLVPVWNFNGSIDWVNTYTLDDGSEYTDNYNYMDDVVVLQINAIDGTVIDPTLGY